MNPEKSKALGRPDVLAAAFDSFLATLEHETTLGTRLNRWSRFVRTRDGHRCVACGSTEQLAAHHITRKSFMWYAQLDPGNGITLCRACHKEPHAGFNRRPNLQQPMDAQGGEKIEVMWSLYQLLLRDAVERSLLCEEFYYINPHVIRSFKLLQGINPDLEFSGGSLEQVCRIWRQTPRHILAALMRANGFEPPQAFIQDGPVSLFFD